MIGMLTVHLSASYNQYSYFNSRIPVANLAELLMMLHNGTINNILSSLIIQEMLEYPDRKPNDVRYFENRIELPFLLFIFLFDQIAEAKNLKQITDIDEIHRICRDILDKNPKAVKQYKEGKQKVYRFFLGEVAKTEKRANMKLVDETLTTLLRK